MIRIDNEFISPYFSEKLLYKEENKEENKNDNLFQIGEFYSLQGDTCEEFKMPMRIYKLIAIIKNINDIALNSIVVKQVENNNDVIFSLTKLDCHLLGINFEPGLELFPIGMDWKKVNKEKKEINKDKDESYDMKYFSSQDLSTYPMSVEDNTIKNMTIRINWREFKNATRNVTNEQAKKIYIQYTDKMLQIFNDNMIFNVHTNIKFNIITNKISENPSPYNNIIDLNGNIFAELTFSFESSKGTIGFITDLLKDKALSDILIVSCDDNSNKSNKELIEKISKELYRVSRAHSLYYEISNPFSEYNLRSSDYTNRHRGYQLDCYNENTNYAHGLRINNRYIYEI